MEKFFGPLGRWVRPDWLSFTNLIFGIAAGYFLYLENYMIDEIDINVYNIMDNFTVKILKKLLIFCIIKRFGISGKSDSRLSNNKIINYLIEFIHPHL